MRLPIPAFVRRFWQALTRPSKVAVGLQSPRSTLCTIARDTPERAASCVSDQPRFSRSRRTLAPMR